MIEWVMSKDGGKVRNHPQQAEKTVGPEVVEKRKWSCSCCLQTKKICPLSKCARMNNVNDPLGKCPAGCW